MIVKNKTILEVKKGERIYQMECHTESTLGEIHDVLCEMKAYIVDRMVDQQEIDECEFKGPLQS